MCVLWVDLIRQFRVQLLQVPVYPHRNTAHRLTYTDGCMHAIPVADRVSCHHKDAIETLESFSAFEGTPMTDTERAGTQVVRVVSDGR